MTTSTHITKQQLTILQLLLRFRFLTRNQLQTILKHKYPRQINKWLKHLTDNNLIYRNYEKTTFDKTRPAIYCLDKKSILYLDNEKQLNQTLKKRIYKDQKLSPRFVNNSLTIVDVFIEVNKQLLDSKKQLFFYTKTDLLEYDFFIKPLPSIYFAIEEKNKKTIRYFFDVVVSDTPRFVFRNRVKKYVEYYLDNTWQINTSFPFPKIVLICQSESLIRYLNKYIKTTLENEGNIEITFKVVKNLPLL